MTLWLHPLCAAFKRPEAVLQALTEAPGSVPDGSALEGVARTSSAHRRLARVDGAERAPSGQAKCRGCKHPIPRGTWRVRLVFFEEGRFLPGGSVHLDCRKEYFEGHDVLDSMLHFSLDLSDDEREELKRACGVDPDPRA
jgi:hypothetical protein